MSSVYNVNIGKTPGLVSPQEVRNELPMDAALVEQVFNQREKIKSILCGDDHRFLIIVGPCSIHDKAAALEFAERLVALQQKVSTTMLFVMRTFFAKPRTTVGWKGLIYDPGMNESHDINRGIRLSRDISLSVARLGLPIATEMLDAFTIEYLSDVISWAAIGARTSESQTHRETASGLSAPVGIKNSTDGHVKNAIDGVEAVNAQHHFWGLRPDGRADYIPTLGNKFAHVVLRGGREGPNYDEATVSRTLTDLQNRGLLEAIIVDCSHGNSKKDYTLQPKVFEEVLNQRLNGQTKLVGAMLESNLIAGNQSIPKPFDSQKLVYGQSVTDGCLGWEETESLILKANTLLSEHLAVTSSQ